MRILGIDPGTQYLGVGIVEGDGPRLVHVDHELLTPKDFDVLPDKLAYIFDTLTDVIVKYRPEAVSIENVFHGKNARSAIVLAHARAVAILAATKQGLPVFEYAPSQVKRAVGASGQAPKEVVTKLVCALLGLKEIERADCADALAIAICHLNRAGVPGSELAAARCARSRASASGAVRLESPVARYRIVRRNGPPPTPVRPAIVRKK